MMNKEGLTQTKLSNKMKYIVSILNEGSRTWKLVVQLRTYTCVHNRKKKYNKIQVSLIMEKKMSDRNIRRPEK